MKRIGWTKMGDRDWYHADFGGLTYDYNHELWRSNKYEIFFGTCDYAMRMLPKIASALDEVPQ